MFIPYIIRYILTYWLPWRECIGGRLGIRANVNAKLGCSCSGLVKKIV